MIRLLIEYIKLFFYMRVFRKSVDTSIGVIDTTEARFNKIAHTVDCIFDHSDREISKFF